MRVCGVRRGGQRTGGGVESPSAGFSGGGSGAPSPPAAARSGEAAEWRWRGDGAARHATRRGGSSAAGRRAAHA
jgi:hypothetical protein